MAAPDPIPDLLTAVNYASGRAFALWITFLTVGTYLTIAIGTTTHVQLLLEGPVKLPLLGVDLPLFSFYVFAPPLFVVLHLYVLMQLYLLARSLRTFDIQLRVARMATGARGIVRTQLDKFMFTQLLVATPESSVIRVFLRVVVWFSFVVGPILLLLGFQLKFLPYHSVPVTYAHRVTLLFDIILLWLLWPRISHGGTRPARLLDERHAGWWAALSILCTGFSMGIATIPDEYLDGPKIWDRIDPTQADIWRDGPVRRRLFLFNAVLIEPDQDKLSKLNRTIRLSERDLRGAMAAYADLRKSDMSQANLRGAVFYEAKLSDTNLRLADLSGVALAGSNLTNADLFYANLTGANLSGANLSRTILSGANLDYADLRNARLSGANLSRTKLTFTRNVSQEQLNAACGDEQTKLPAGLTIKPCPEKQ